MLLKQSLFLSQIEESEVLDATDAETRFAVLRSELGREKVGLIHGRMKPDEKDEAFADFIAVKNSSGDQYMGVVLADALEFQDVARTVLARSPNSEHVRQEAAPSPCQRRVRRGSHEPCQGVQQPAVQRLPSN